MSEAGAVDACSLPMSNLAGEIPIPAISNGATASQPRKRRKLTEKRRAQNREAQRLFRERKRKKVFETLQQSTDPEYWNSRANSSITPQPESSSSETLGVAHSKQPGARIEIPTRISREQEVNEFANQLYNLDVDYVREKRAGRNLSVPGLISLHWLLNDPKEPEPTPANIPDSYESFYTTSHLKPNSPKIIADELQAPSHADNGERSSRSENSPVITVEGVPSDYPPDFGDDVTEVQRSVPAPQTGDFLTNSTAQLLGRYTLKEIIAAGLEALAAKEHHLDTRLSRSQRTWDKEEWASTSSIEDASNAALSEMLVYAPSPCRTQIDLHEITTFKAVVINAKAIGFWNPIPDDFKDPYKSPFVQAYFMNDQSVEKVQQKYADIVEPLKPSAVQCRTPHKAYIDVFPFPGFRERVINAATRGLMNEIEFCADLGKSALMCWGTGQGKYGGEPWNPKSWEAQQWFIEKWDALIDDEMRECSRAWRELRESEGEVDGMESGFIPTVVLD